MNGGRGFSLSPVILIPPWLQLHLQTFVLFSLCVSTQRLIPSEHLPLFLTYCPPNTVSTVACTLLLAVPLQAIGWSILLFLIMVGALGRLIKPCFDNHGASMQTRYWSNYLDVEQKLFDETVALHTRDFARKCVVQFFEGVQEEELEREVLHLLYPRPPFTGYRQVVEDEGGGEREREEEMKAERLYGMTRQEQVNRMLIKWFDCKPELDVTHVAHRNRVCITWKDSYGRSLYSDV